MPTQGTTDASFATADSILFMARKRFDGLASFVDYLREEDQLIEINVFVDPELEITEFADRVMKMPEGGKALLFNNTGTGFQLLINAYGSEQRILDVMRLESYDEFNAKVSSFLKQITAPPKGLTQKLSVLSALRKVAGVFPKNISRKGKCQEVVMDQPDLARLPVLKCWPYDGGPYITLPVVHTRNPLTGKRNVGMYRMQVYGPDSTGMHWQIHKGGASHFRETKGRMPVVVTLGGDPIYAWCASAPLPPGIDEYMLAGYLRGTAVKMVACLSQPISVPEDCDFVIEGYVDAEEPLRREGPFGDHTGFYSLDDLYPVFHVTCITHRKNAVYPATIVGVPPMEDAWFIRATEKLFGPLISKSFLPELADLFMPFAGVAHNLAIASIRAEYPGHALKVMNAVWGIGQLMFTKVLILVDEGVNIRNKDDLFKVLRENVRIPEDIYFSSGPLDVLDHAAASPALGGKIGIDATSGKRAEPAYLPISKFAAEGWFADNLPVFFLPLKQDEDGLAKLEKVLETTEVPSVAVLCDEGLASSMGDLVLWHALAGIDPARDCRMHLFNGKKILLADCRSKPMKGRWPQVVSSLLETRLKVDERWTEIMGLHLIQSPSYKIDSLIKGEGAEMQRPEN